MDVSHKMFCAEIEIFLGFLTYDSYRGAISGNKISKTMIWRSYEAKPKKGSLNTKIIQKSNKHLKKWIVNFLGWRRVSQFHATSKNICRQSGNRFVRLFYLSEKIVFRYLDAYNRERIIKNPNKWYRFIGFESNSPCFEPVEASKIMEKSPMIYNHIWDADFQLKVFAKWQ